MKSKEKKQRVKKTPKQHFVKLLKVLLIIVMILAVIAGVIAVVNIGGVKSNSKFIKNSIDTISFDSQLEPELDDDGCYSFTTDREFRVMQLTDVHIGAGFMSKSKDKMALNAVAAMITTEKPDLVVVTGDIAYPVPFQSGTFNNKTSATLFADLMEKLGVYWCLCFGNHDTEAYSYFSRESIAKVYENHDKYKHCLFQSGDKDVDGEGNYAIKVKNTEGKITQALFVFDSHSYVDNDYFGALWKYDCVHKNQIDWYNSKLADFKAENGGEMPKSLAFQHIPVIEFREAYYAYRDNGFKDTEDIKWNYGKAGEHKDVVYSGEKNEGLFDAFVNSGSTQGAFFGHDHLNNISLNYNGVNLSYGNSIDYLAYTNISKYGLQRGCAIITVNSDGSYTEEYENYYQDKYVSPAPKEEVVMTDYNTDIDQPEQ